MLIQRHLLIVSIGILAVSMSRTDDGLIGYWKLQGECRDYSSAKNDGRARNVDLSTSSFNGRDSSVDVDGAKSAQIGDGDFSITLDVNSVRDVRGAFGSLVSKFDSKRRRGFDLALCSNSSGYNGQSDVRQLVWGLDDNT